MSANPSNHDCWFRKTPEELQELFAGLSFSWEEVTAIVSSVRGGDHCEGSGLRRGWEIYVERAGASKLQPAELCRLLAAWAVEGAALAPAKLGAVWEISAADARALLANAFWGNLGDPMREFKERRNRGGLSFDRLYSSTGVAAEKMACLWCYFDSVADGVCGHLRFERLKVREGVGDKKVAAAADLLARAAADERIPEGEEGCVPLKVQVHSGSMEDVEAEGIMNFANRNFAYGKIIASATQEEVLLICHPEVHVGMLVFAQMDDDEAIVVRGARRFSAFSPEAAFAGRAHAGEPVAILTADACLSDHFSEANNARDVLKAFLVFGEVKSVSSGRWGCGMFGGSVQHKLLQQIIAARLAGLETLYFSAFHDEVFASAADLLANLCARRSLAELVSTLRKHSEMARASPGVPGLSVVQHLQLAYPGDRPCCVLLNHGSFNPIHRAHIAMMTEAKRAAEAVGYTVVKGILAPTSCQHLEWKAQQNPAEVQVMSEEARSQAMDASVRPHGYWLEVDRRGTQESSGAIMLHRTVLPELERKGLGPCVGFTVIGTDVMNQPRRHGFPCVFVGRELAGNGTGLEQQIAEANRERHGAPPHLYVPSLPGGDASSTQVRAALKRGDRASVEELCGVAVAGVLMNWREGGALWAKQAFRWPCSGKRHGARAMESCVLM